MNLKDKNTLIAIGVVLVVLLGGVFLMNSKKKSAQKTGDGDVFPTAEVLPTVDASVKVSLEANAKKTEVTLTIDGIPADTTDIEYELSYLAEGDLPKGVIGTIPVEGTTITREITLGTCSSGKCVYDKGVEKIKVSLKFNSDAGAKIFEKEFDI